MSRRATGFTLIELVMAIIVISIALTGILLAYVTVVARSADPLLMTQAVAIAEGYMDEILAKDVCGAPAGGARADFACVEDYAGLNEAPTNQFGVAIGALSSYAVSVQVANASFGTPAVSGKRIDVTVSHGSGTQVSLTGHKVP